MSAGSWIRRTLPATATATAAAAALTGVPAAGAATFVNPVVETGADPWVLSWQGAYLYCYVRRGQIYIAKADRLQDIGAVPQVAVWSPPAGTPYSREIWAPELHHLDGRWYIYFAADDGQNASHRMYVLESAAADPQGIYTFRGKVATADDHWAIDGTVLALDNGARYFIWSGWEGAVDVQQNLYVAAMKNPWTLAGERGCIAVPDHGWEQIGRPLVNEGAVVLKKHGRVFVIYSASGSWTDDYCLGQLELTGADPLKKESWVKKPDPVFSRTPSVFGPGHASFVTSPDGTEDWMVYHAAKYSGAGWKRDIRIQRFNWTADGQPTFGRPVPVGVAVVEPAGTAVKAEK